MVTERQPSYVISNPRGKEKTLVAITPETPRVSLETVLVDLYWRQGMSMREIGKLIDRDQGTVGRYFKKFTIKVRSPQESHRLFWRNSERRQIHSEAMRKSWKGNTERRKRQGELTRELFSKPEIRTKRREAMQQRARAKTEQALGANPKKTLKQLIQKERLNNKQIAQKLSVSVYQVTVWKNSFGIELGRIYHPRISPVNKDVFQKAKKVGLLTKLTLNQQSVLEKRYGKPLVSLDKIAKSRGVTRQAVNLTELRAIKKLQELLAS